MRRIRKTAFFMAGLGVGLLSTGARAENIPAPPETLSATFTHPDGGVTTNSYWGKVLIHATGVGQSYAWVQNDAFYLFDGPFEGAVSNGWDGSYYQLAFGPDTPLIAFDQGYIARTFLVGPLPEYNANHDYTFMLDTRLDTPAPLHFGVNDGGYSDNTGSYDITVTQLVPDAAGDWVPAQTRTITTIDAAHAPEPASLALLSLGALPLLRRRRRQL